MSVLQVVRSDTLLTNRMCLAFFKEGTVIRLVTRLCSSLANAQKFFLRNFTSQNVVGQVLVNHVNGLVGWLQG